MPFPSLGQEVILRGTITSIFSTEQDDPTRQAFNVRLEDGQAIHTNIRNMFLFQAEESTDETPDLPAPDVSEAGAPDEHTGGDPEASTSGADPTAEPDPAGETDGGDDGDAKPTDDATPDATT